MSEEPVVENEPDVEKVYLRITPYGRTDNVAAIGVEMRENLAKIDLTVGTQLTLTVVGVERKAWEGLEVR
jgi:hypothetical protein